MYKDGTKDNTNGDDTRPPTRRRRTALKGGRARRKRELKRREEDSDSSDDEADTAIHENEASGERRDPDLTYHSLKDYVRAEQEGNVFFGMPANPLRERYIRSLRKRKYPRSIGGWRTVWKRTWEKYLWTFEGFLLPVKQRDPEGNVMSQEQIEEARKDEEEEISIKEKATEAADQISQNVQKNISTIKEEAPKLVKFGQEVTGISTREELRVWVGEQLKLGTACLSEFMKGYRKGRDDEVDRMLHEYFKELDSDTDKPEAGAASNKAKDQAEKTQDEEIAEEGVVKRGKRTWGRRERRRLKARSGISETD
ncbi:hypothetical protein ACHAXT_008103 [Thalassiosira profunda]